MKKMKKMNAGRSLRLLMTEDNVSGRKLAADLALTPTTISILRKSPTLSGGTLERLSNYFNVSVSEFIIKGED